MKRNISRKEIVAGKNEDTKARGYPHDFEHRRILCTAFKFWSVCGARCRRAQACTGDPGPCFDRCWPHVPEDLKNWYRCFIKALGNGMSPKEANEHAKAELARWAEIKRGWDEAKQTAAAVPPVAAPPARLPVADDTRHRGPRIRQL